MNVLFLCAGYGTRLMRDLRGDSVEAQDRKHMIGLPKALLPIAGKTILDRWLNLLLSTPQVKLDNIFLVCNDHFHDQFVAWAAGQASFPADHIFNDGTSDNGSRLGANRDISAAVDYFDVKFPATRNNLLLVIAGDTLFLNDFDMADFIDTAFKVFQTSSTCSLVTHYKLKEDWETRLTGILVLEQRNVKDNHDIRIDFAIDFLEKPEPSETTSRLACPCFYVLNRTALSQLKNGFLEDHAKLALETFDATGKFIGWLVKRANPAVASYPISGRLDIGALASLVQAEEYFSKIKESL